MMTETRDLPDDTRYEIFQALSHPVRVRILLLLADRGCTFSSLKHELGMESSGQLQHHMQKLSTLVNGDELGTYHLTYIGTRALEIYRDSEKSGASLRDVCCLPAISEMAHDHQITIAGFLLRFSVGSVLSVLTAAIVANYLFVGSTFLKVGGASFFIGDALAIGFFGISFLISAFTGYPGCEITAIPNLFTARRRYCSCIITPFNIPNGRLLRRDREVSSLG